MARLSCPSRSAPRGARPLPAQSGPLTRPLAPTRPPALAQGVHPEFICKGSAEASERALTTQEAAALTDLTARIRRYRPAATVFEAEVAPIRHNSAGGIPGFTSARAVAHSEVMKEKRAQHAGAIAQQIAASAVQAHAAPQAAPRKGKKGAAPAAAAGPSFAFVATGKYRDERFFLDPVPKTAHFVEKGLSNRPQAGASALQDNVLDLIADDAEGQAAQRAVVRWDSRKRRYVTMHGCAAASPQHSQQD